MTDTTEQQAVTVEQEDREAAADLFCIVFPTDKSIGAAMRRPIGDGGPWAQAFARHRLASVSSASADTPGGTFACPICGKDTPHYHSPEEVAQHRETEAWVEESWQQARPLFFPEPVPATNQAGKVEEAVSWLRAISDWLLTHDHDMTLPDGILDTDPLDIADRLASLATQPATSQEGEQVIAAAYRAGYEQACEDNGDRVDEDDLEEEIALYLAATPTPPTLSEDLRAALSDQLDDVDDRLRNGAIACSVMLGKPQAEWFRAALARAQVKASLSGGVEGVALLPCPFCNNPMEDRGYGVMHTDGNRGGRCILSGSAFPSVTAWNARTAPPARTYAEGVQKAVAGVLLGEMFMDPDARWELAGKIAAAIRLLSRGEKG